MVNKVTSNPGNIKTGTLGLAPGVSNLYFNNSANITPSYHVGVKSYSEGGYVAHPLSYTGQPGPAARMSVPPAGQLATAPGGVAWSIGHPYTINGKEPG
jgi:hypothetical protein